MAVDYPVFIGPGSLGHYGDNSQTSLNTVYDLKTNTDWFAMPMCVRETKQIDDIGFWLSGVSGTTAQYFVGIMTMNNTGAPTTTNYGGSSGTVLQASQFVYGWNWISLSIPATGTAGEFAALQIKCLNVTDTNYISASRHRVYFSNTPRTRTQRSGIDYFHPLMAIRYSDGTVQGMTLGDFSDVVMRSDTTPDEYGNKFTVPESMTCVGARVTATLSSNTSFRINLYQDEDVIRSVYVFDEDIIDANWAEAGYEVYWEAKELEPGVNYRITAQAASASASISVPLYTLISGSYSYIFPGADSWQATYRTNSGSFTDESTKRVWLGALIRYITPSTGTSTVITVSGGTSAYAWAY